MSHRQRFRYRTWLENKLCGFHQLVLGAVGKETDGTFKVLEEDEFCSFKMNDIGLGGWYPVKGYRYSIFEKDIINKIK